MMTLYAANCIGNERNCSYPHKLEIRDEATFAQAVTHDYVAISYQDHRRKKDNFLSSDCLALDCNNNRSEIESEWITPEKVLSFFQGVTVGFHFSRNHMKQKGESSPRPRFHCFFSIRPTESAEDYAALQRRVAQLFPYFDRQSLVAARFFYGTSNPQVRLCPGPLTLDQWLEQREVDQPTDPRNPGNFQYEPTDKSDVAEARVLAHAFREKMRFCTATDFLVYNGKFWEDNQPKAHGLMHTLSDMQLEEAETALALAQKEGDENGMHQILLLHGNSAEDYMNEEQKQTFYKEIHARSYQKIAMQYRQSRNIKAVLEEVQPMIQIRPEELDRDPCLLNTPAGTYDLRKGLRGKRDHNPKDYLTRITAVSPSDKGAKLWEEALDTFFQGDQALKDYVQLVAGMIAVGEVRREEMIIAYGEGRNGKSTFWNVISKVLGSYSGTISADVLTQSCHRNVKPELAEIRGKRMLIASELEEGLRLNTATVKQLCSTDPIKGEAKYRAPFDFEPSHTLILYTNHLPKVGAKDVGIWRRLIVIPFQAKIQGSSDRKNYTRELLDNAGGAILSWIIEGAEKIIAMQFQLDLPPCVKEAIGQYQNENDWLAHFLDDRCLREATLTQKSGELYTAYRRYCADTGEYTRSTTDFYTALENDGFPRRKTERGMIIQGLQLTPFSDFSSISAS